MFSSPDGCVLLWRNVDWRVTPEFLDSLRDMGITMLVVDHLVWGPQAVLSGC